MTLEQKIDRLRELVEGSDNIVFFGGAGVSTESDIPDFRSANGLWNEKLQINCNCGCRFDSYGRLFIG